MLTTPAPRQLRSLGDEDLAVVYVVTRDSIYIYIYIIFALFAEIYPMMDGMKSQTLSGCIGGW